MKKPYLSIIIPAYNSAKTIEEVLFSIFTSSFKEFEVIVIDDLSEDKTLNLVKKFKKEGKHKNLRFIRVKTKKGAGGARNLGARHARGEVLVFLDSDTLIPDPKSLQYIAKRFRKQDIKAVVGTLDKIPANPNPSFFHHFKALNYYSYWVHERDKRLPVGGFGGALGCIQKDLFEEIGGYDEEGKGAVGEVQEVAFKINQKTKLYFDPKLRVRHYFHDLAETLKRFYFRSYKWMGFFEEHKTFFGPAVNPKEALIAGLANTSSALFFLALFWKVFWPFFVAFFALRVFLGRKFLHFVLKEKGLGFLIVSIFFSHSLYLAVYLGVGRYFIEKLLRKL